MGVREGGNRSYGCLLKKLVFTDAGVVGDTAFWTEVPEVEVLAGLVVVIWFFEL